MFKLENAHVYVQCNDNICYKMDVWLDSEGLGLAKEMEGSIPSIFMIIVALDTYVICNHGCSPSHDVMISS